MLHHRVSKPDIKCNDGSDFRYVFQFTYLQKVISYILQRVALSFRETFLFLHRKKIIKDEYMSNITLDILR